MNPEFSEFQFTYGLTRELETQLPMAGVPFLPTQSLENEFPIDVGIPLERRRFIPLLLQYKRSKALTQANAREWDDFEREYYRFGIYPPEKSDQHNKLVELSSYFDAVYYVAPAFYQQSSYRRYARREELNRHSVLVDCGTCPTINSGESHSIAYSTSPVEARFYSEPTEIGARSGFQGLVEDLRYSDADNFESIGQLRRTFRSAHEVLGEDPIDIDPQEDTEQWIRAEQEFFFQHVGSNLTFVVEPLDE